MLLAACLQAKRQQETEQHDMQLMAAATRLQQEQHQLQQAQADLAATKEALVKVQGEVRAVGWRLLRLSVAVVARVVRLDSYQCAT